MKALVGAFNQEKALVGAFSVIVKTGCGTNGALHSTTPRDDDDDHDVGGDDHHGDHGPVPQHPGTQGQGGHRGERARLPAGPHLHHARRHLHVLTHR